MEEERKSAVEVQFDQDACKYLEKHLNPEKIREKDRILELIGDQAPYERILDIGCGPGTISLDLLGIGDRVWGIDISESMINTAKARFMNTKVQSRLHFETGDAENLKFPDHFFDVVICLGVLRYLDSWENCLQEIYRVLKPNGVVVLTFYYQFSPHWFSMFFLYRPLLPFISLAKQRSLRELIIKYKAEPLPFSYKKFSTVFAHAGFSHIKTLHSGFDVFPFNRLFSKVSRFLYLKVEPKWYDSNRFGWLGSICIVKGLK